MFKKIAPVLTTALISLACAAGMAQEIKIGLTGTFTGANAANGIPYRNTSEIYP
ncbi:MAG: branched-chain amino acid ABC transporter substrate-binding protein, partial [Rhodoferax sp.]|nr:branched-chain amino acid ABC transporter substrate-binding protein [Rhodoferax sp.]